MNEEINMTEVVSEIKNATEDELRKVIENWYERTRTDGLRIGAKYMAAGVLGAMQKHLNSPKPSLRDYERCIKDIRKLLTVALAQQNAEAETATDEVVEESVDDGATE